eukprot:TRINITY_DN1211_c0_g1_i4.p1 TRINITY_DN1211_c0_g1~~TRINITY_DN1211_c0_g1_i4.p1  ORF type:complete len:1508 (+),score=342.80 TRINITY_DN1211_c0_g1_i4:80-4603(+)
MIALFLRCFLVAELLKGTVAKSTFPDSAKAASKSPKLNLENRLIVRYEHGLSAVDGGSNFEASVAKLRSLPGVRRVESLRHIDMAIVETSSEDDGEALLESLSAQAGVELVVPDTLVHLETNSNSAGNSNATTSSSCSAHPRCAHLYGECCPAKDNTTLACCDAPIHGGDEIVASDSSKFALQTHNGGHVAMGPHGDVWTSSSGKLWAHHMFSVISNDDGTVSLKGHHKRYLTALPTGLITAHKEMSGNSKFKIDYHRDGSITLKAQHGKYVAVQAGGHLKAMHDDVANVTKLTVVTRHGRKQYVPDDSSFGKLWGMSHFAHHDIQAPEGWKIFSGETDKPITVAVIDTGIDYTHEDLKDQMWVNPGEIPDNGIDDDGNGIIDDIHGADFANNDGDPMDDQMHGTHCSGTIAGMGNNHLGVTGVAWRGVRLMGLKFLTASGSGRSSDALKAVNYAIAHGAKVASNSWGGGGSSSAMRIAIQRAEKTGMLFVVAAGNDGTDNDEQPQYPANYPSANIISVASTTKAGPLSGFSCFGYETVDVAAPGSNIYSTIPNQKYASLSGTSMACPHVSGLAALVWLYRPNLAMHQVRDIILQSATSESFLNGTSVTGARINVRAALELARTYKAPVPPKHQPQSISFIDVDSRVGKVSGTVTIGAATDESDVEFYSAWFISKAGFLLDYLGSVNATGKAFYRVELNGSRTIPKYFGGVVALSGNSECETKPGVAQVEIEDYGVPEVNAESVTWLGDSDGHKGKIDGNLQVQRASDEKSIGNYNVYWQTASGARGAKIGSIPAAGFRKPSCDGDCELLERTNLSSGSYRFHRGPYGASERATISFSGPAEVLITHFSTEYAYDGLEIGSKQISGTPKHLPMTVELPAGPTHIAWTSDFSENGAGWTIELKQLDSNVEFHVPKGKPEGPSVEVVASYGHSEFPEGLATELTDFDAKTMPPSAAFVPKAIHFADNNVALGEVSGDVVFDLSDAAQAHKHVVKFYRVSIANSNGEKVGSKEWKVDAPTHGKKSSVSLSIHDLVPPTGAARLVVQAGSDHGISEATAWSRLSDIVRSPPSGATWSGDTSPVEGQIKGNLTILPAETTAGILAYAVYTANRTNKYEFVGRAHPHADGGPMTMLIDTSVSPGDGLLVVSAYASGAMDTGVFVEVADFVDPNATSGGWMGDGGFRRLHDVDDELPQPWLQRPRQPSWSELQLLWTAVAPFPSIILASGVEMAQPDATSGRKILGSLTIPGILTVPVSGIEKVQVPVAEQRAAIRAALAGSLPGVKPQQVTLLRGAAISGDAAKAGAVHATGAGRRLAAPVKEALNQHAASLVVDFEVTEDTSETGLKGQSFLDRVEARLIMLSRGGTAAARFDSDLSSRLRAARSTFVPDGLRTLLAEPKQVIPRETVKSRSFKGRGLSSIVSDQDESEASDVAFEDESQEEAGSALASAIAIVGGVAFLGLAAFFVRQRQSRRFEESHFAQDTTEGCHEADHQPLQSVSVEVHAAQAGPFE